MDAVHDGATLQILYEGKTADSALNEKHAFDTAFEDLFKDRSEEELLAIKKKYGATGDILEAENRINAIAKRHGRALRGQHPAQRLQGAGGVPLEAGLHPLPGGIEAALAERASRRSSAKATPDAELIERLRFLKTAVVISSDGTNEAAYITHARKQAARMNAVDNFCRSFDLDDADKAYTGIAFLIVCDMLLTGFDAPIEQVMYIDKKLREHTCCRRLPGPTGSRRGSSAATSWTTSAWPTT
jgi:type I restriction enzyme, R subunit